MSDFAEDTNVPTNDCISRRAAIKGLAKFVPYPILDKSTESYMNGLTDAYNLICQLPSAEPKKGKWIKKPDPYGFFDEIPVCSQCGCTTKWREEYKYCPNCGARMGVTE